MQPRLLGSRLSRDFWTPLQVKATLLYNNGQPIAGTEVTLRTVPSGWTAWQTQVAWSPNESVWLVAWTEAKYNVTPKANGIVQTRYVDFNGSHGPLRERHHVLRTSVE